MKTNRFKNTQRNAELSTLSALALGTLTALVAGPLFYFACTFREWSGF